jgi:hypothetical protein
MGYPLMFYVAEDIRELLKQEANRSELINNLLRDYFEIKKEKKMSLEEINLKIKENEIKLEAIKKIEDLKNAPTN